MRFRVTGTDSDATRRGMLTKGLTNHYSGWLIATADFGGMLKGDK
jgi:hypothetical protein